jgi:hypothetical protein
VGGAGCFAALPVKDTDRVVVYRTITKVPRTDQFDNFYIANVFFS